MYMVKLLLLCTFKYLRNFTLSLDIHAHVCVVWLCVEMGAFIMCLCNGNTEKLSKETFDMREKGSEFISAFKH